MGYLLDSEVGGGEDGLDFHYQLSVDQFFGRYLKYHGSFILTKIESTSPLVPDNAQHVEFIEMETSEFNYIGTPDTSTLTG